MIDTDPLTDIRSRGYRIFREGADGYELYDSEGDLLEMQPTLDLAMATIDYWVEGSVR